MTRIADPIERAARIIARADHPGIDWNDLTLRAQLHCRDTARIVIDDYVLYLHENGHADDEEPF